MEFAILKEDQVLGKNALDIFKTFGPTAAPTDLAALQYCWVFPQGKTAEGKRSGSYYIQSDNTSILMDAPVISPTGQKDYLYLSNPQGGVRPVIPAVEAEKITPVSIRELKIKGKGSLQIFTFGEYPQKISDRQTQDRLNSLYFAGLKLRKRTCLTSHQVTTFTASFQEGSYVAHDSPLRRTRRKFTLNDRIPHSYDSSFLPRAYQEFRLGERKFIQFFPHKTEDSIILSSGHKISQPNIHYWIEVLPIDWIKDNASGIWIAKDILLSNIKMDDKPFQQRTGLFQKSSLKDFLKNTFSREILPPVRIARKGRTVRANKSRQREY